MIYLICYKHNENELAAGHPAFDYEDLAIEYLESLNNKDDLLIRGLLLDAGQ